MGQQTKIRPMMVAGNRLSLLPEGRERLNALIALIDEAQESLRVLYYIWENDESGRSVRDALLRALERGVHVSLLVDGFGAWNAPAGFFQPLIDAQARFCRFVPRWGRRFLLRNHQKLTLADGKRAIIGGFNIKDEYFGTAEEGAWRDLGLELEGSAAKKLVGYFDALFAWAETENASIRRLRRMLSRHSFTDGPLHWLFGGPTRRLSPWAKAVKNDLMGATRLDMIVAYFAPSRSMVRRIYGVARRGKVRIVTPAKSDYKAAVRAARHFYWRLLKRKAEVYEYQPTRLHTKLIIIDDAVHIGSANFDLRSLYLNLEMMLRINDPAFAEMMRRYVDGEIAESRRVTLEEHRAQRNWWAKMIWWLSYLIVAAADYNVARRLNFGRVRLGR